MIGKSHPSPVDNPLNTPATTWWGGPAVRITGCKESRSIVLPLRTFGAILALGDWRTARAGAKETSRSLSRAYPGNISTLSSMILRDGADELINRWGTDVPWSVYRVNEVGWALANTHDRSMLVMDCVLPSLGMKRTRWQRDVAGLRLKGGLRDIMRDGMMSRICARHGVRSLQSPPLGTTGSWGDTDNGIALRYAGLPDDFPSFEFRPDTTLSAGLLRISLSPDVDYVRICGDVHLDVRVILPQTLLCSLPGTRLERLIKVDGLEDETIEDARQTDGILTLTLRGK